MATIPCAVEKNVSSRICGVPGGNRAIDVQWPVETFLLFKLGNLNSEELQSVLASSILWDGSKRIAHGRHSYKKDSIITRLIDLLGEIIGLQ